MSEDVAVAGGTVGLVGWVGSERAIRRAVRILRIGPAPGGRAGGGRPTPLLLTGKLAPPALGREHVPRPALRDRLDELTRGRLTVVAAPPGFGKTTALAEWRASRPGDVAWVSLDADDNDPRRLWAHVLAALRGAEPRLEDAATAPGEPGTHDEAARLLNAAAAMTRPLVLVLDDYHLVRSRLCHDLVGFMVEHLPGTLRLVLSTRRDPPLAVARLRAQGQLGELRARDLRFSAPEARALLVEALALRLGDSHVERLHDRTDGWPAGLYLAAVSLRERDEPARFVDDFTGSNRHIVDYLTSEVLAGASARTSAFLLGSATLDRMSGPLCDAVLQTSGSTERLRALARANLLVEPLDDDLLWFRYHPLLREMLRLRQAEADPELAAELHARASRWFEERQDVDRAVEHALAARDGARAARLLGRGWRPVAAAGGTARINRWLESVPAAVVLADPGLCLMRAVLEESRGAPREAVERWLDAAERHGESVPPGSSPLPFGTDSVLLETALVRAAAAGHDVAGQLESARRAFSLAAGRGAFARGVGATYLAYWLLLAGRSVDARAVAREAIDEGGARALPLLSAVQLAVASLAEAATGDEAAADEHAALALDRLRAHGHEASPQASVVWLASGMARARRGALAEAEDALRHAVALADSPALVLDRAHALIALARVLKAGGDVGAGAQAAGEARRLVAAAEDPGVLRRVLRGVRSPADGPGPAEPMSEAELRILRLLPSELTLRQIGERLFLSVNTVKSHTRAVYRKLGATSRREAVEAARAHGLI
jgi:LuxR family maltose regulon positive regulatory protein